MEGAEDVYELLTHVERTDYSPDSIRRELEAVCASLGVTLRSDSQLPRDALEIQPGHARKKTALLLEGEQGPKKPTYSRRPSREGFSTYLELVDQGGYDAVVSIGPYAVARATQTDGHKYLTAQVEGDISNVPHLSYLTVESCEELLTGFFCSSGLAETDQQSLDEY